MGTFGIPFYDSYFNIVKADRDKRIAEETAHLGRQDVRVQQQRDKSLKRLGRKRTQMGEELGASIAGRGLGASGIMKQGIGDLQEEYRAGRRDILDDSAWQREQIQHGKEMLRLNAPSDELLDLLKSLSQASSETLGKMF